MRPGHAKCAASQRSHHALVVVPVRPQIVPPRGVAGSGGGGEDVRLRLISSAQPRPDYYLVLVLVLFSPCFFFFVVGVEEIVVDIVISNFSRRPDVRDDFLHHAHLQHNDHFATTRGLRSTGKPPANEGMLNYLGVETRCELAGK